MPGPISRGCCWSLLWLLGFSWEKGGIQLHCGCPEVPAMQSHMQQHLSSLPNLVTMFALCLLQLTWFLLYPLAGQRVESSALIFQCLWSAIHSIPSHLHTVPSSPTCQKTPSSQLAGVQPASAPPSRCVLPVWPPS